jgi:hypothetical protein
MRGQLTLMNMLSILAAAVLTALLVNLLTYYGPIVEGNMWPVAEATHVEIMQSGKEELIVQGTMNKYRDCELLSTSAYITDAAGQRVLAQIQTAKTTILRPVTSGQPFGPWYVSVPVWYKSAELSTITRHQCHPLWQTRSVYFRKVIE